MGWIIINIIHKNIIQSESGLDYVKIGSWHNGTLNINRLQFDDGDDDDDDDGDDDGDDDDDDCDGDDDDDDCDCHGDDDGVAIIHLQPRPRRDLQVRNFLMIELAVHNGNQSGVTTFHAFLH